MYKAQPALFEVDFESQGFEWVDSQSRDESVLAFLRKSKNGAEEVLVVLNFTPVPRHNHRIGVPQRGHWREILNSDAPLYGGSGQGNLGGVETTPVACHGQLQSLTITLPPLGMVAFKAGER